MKTILSLRRHHYLKTVGIFLIAVALIAGVVSCNGGATYKLTMAEAPAGTGTATDETGTSPYAEDTVVDIKAVAAPCYRFVSWTAPAGAFGNATAAVTTFTMPPRAVTVTANFEPVPPDHYKFYFAEWQGGEPPETLPVDVQLKDQFGTFDATVGDVLLFGNPVKKVHGDTTTPISDFDRHYTLYELDYGEEEPMLDSWQVTISNQFGDNQELTVWGPVALAVPTQKEDQEMSDCLDHLLLYNIQHPVEYVPEAIGEVDLYDQFHDELDVTVYEPMFFANPVEKTIVDTGDVTPATTDEHYVFYPMEETFEKSGVPITNQFGDQILDIGNPALLAVPSQKISWGQPLDHFKTYWAVWPMEPSPPTTFPAEVQLEDQFIADWLGESLNATVYEPWLFANPVNKGISEEVWTPISNWNNHLTFYYIGYEEDTQVWEVTVSNQFDPLGPLVEPPVYQTLWVKGPSYLAVPTQKGDQDPPADLDHFLVYDVIDWSCFYPGWPVFLRDQFIEGWTNMYEPEFFAVPVQKTYKGEVTERVNPTEHLVFYVIAGIHPWNVDGLPVVNQFGEQYLDVEEGEGNFLGVPSEKLDVDGPWPYEPPPP